MDVSHHLVKKFVHAQSLHSIESLHQVLQVLSPRDLFDQSAEDARLESVISLGSSVHELVFQFLHRCHTLAMDQWQPHFFGFRRFHSPFGLFGDVCLGSS